MPKYLRTLIKQLYIQFQVGFFLIVTGAIMVMTVYCSCKIQKCLLFSDNFIGASRHMLYDAC